MHAAPTNWSRYPPVQELQRCTLGRPRGKQEMSWAVDWDVDKGIPLYVNRDWKGNKVYGSGFILGDDDVNLGMWPFEALAKLAVMEQRLDTGINEMLAARTPYPEAKIMKVSYGGSGSFYCERCRQQWPCQTFYELRSLYAKVTGWSADAAKFEPLKMRRQAIPSPKEFPIGG